MIAALFAVLVAAQAAPAVQLVSTPPTAPAPAAAPAAAAAPAPPPEDPMDHVVCHWQDPEGTRFGSHKACHSRREWLRLQHNG